MYGILKISGNKLEWKSKTRVTSYKLRVQIQKFLVQIHELRV